jgi:hypothetical protein
MSKTGILLGYFYPEIRHSGWGWHGVAGDYTQDTIEAGAVLNV